MGRQRRGEGRVLKLDPFWEWNPPGWAVFASWVRKIGKWRHSLPVVVKRSVVKSSSQGGLGYI